MKKYEGLKRVKEYPDKPIYSLDMKQFGPLFELDKKLKYLEGMDLSRVGYKKIEGMLFELLQQKAIHYTAIRPFQKLYRGRIYNPDKEKITHKENFWYPKKEYVKKRGRLNSKDEVVFYGVNKLDCIFDEIGINENNSVVISESALNDVNGNYNFVQLGLNEETLKKIKVNRENEESIRNEEKRKYNSNLFINNIPISDASESFLIENFFHKFMSKKSKNESFYKITNAIGKLWFMNDDIKGIAYPNINSFLENSLVGYNVAIKPEIVDKLYKVNRIWLIRIEKIYKTEDKRIKLGLDVEKISNILKENGEIVWEDEILEEYLPGNLKEINRTEIEELLRKNTI